MADLMNKLFAGGLPMQASTFANSYDTIYNFMVVLSIVCTVGVIGAMLYFAWAYRQGGRDEKTDPISHHNLLEVIWTAIPTVIVVVLFAWGWVVYDRMTTIPSDALEIKVVGKQWIWFFQYEDGRTTTNEFFVPVDTPVQLKMSSEDVLHSLFIPAFRVKQDVVPGMYTRLWFNATVSGTHQVYCTEYCGAEHSGMLAKVHVLEQDQWKRWLRGKEVKLASGEVRRKKIANKKASKLVAKGVGNLVNQGKHLVKVRGCVSCHSSDGSHGIGPSYVGSFGKERTLVDGTKIKVDDQYLRQSIEEPNAKLVQGYAAVMPTFKGQLTEIEMNAVIAYIKSLKTN